MPSWLENLPAYATVSKLFTYLSYNPTLSTSSVRVVNCCSIDRVTPCVAEMLFSAAVSSVTIECECSIEQVSIPIVDLTRSPFRTVASFLLPLPLGLNVDV